MDEPSSLHDEPPSTVFLDPLRYGDDSGRAVGAYEVTTPAGCVFGVSVRWELAGDVIVGEDRYVEVGSAQQCDDLDLGEGWWTDLDLPGPRDLIVTGTVPNASGGSIEVHNGTPDLVEVVTWGFERFRGGGARRTGGRFGHVRAHPDVCGGVWTGDRERRRRAPTLPVHRRDRAVFRTGTMWAAGPQHQNGSTPRAGACLDAGSHGCRWARRDVASFRSGGVVG